MLKSIDRLTITWVLLSGITVLSWRLGLKHAGQPIELDTAITAGVLGFALVKARFIMREFMDVRTAPRSIKWLTDVWLVGLFGLLMLLYWRAR